MRCFLLSLIYWAQMNSTDPLNKESVIRVASMADPEHTSEIARITGAPISISLAITDDVAGVGKTAGRLCWLERRQILPISRTEIHCAQLDVSGRGIYSKRLLKSFDHSDEPSCGLIQDGHTILWTNLYRYVFKYTVTSFAIE